MGRRGGSRKEGGGGVSNLTWMTTDYQTSYDLIAPLISPLLLPPFPPSIHPLSPLPLLPLSFFLSSHSCFPDPPSSSLFLLLSFLCSQFVLVITPSHLAFFFFTPLLSLPSSASSSSPLVHFLPPAPHLS